MCGIKGFGERCALGCWHHGARVCQTIAEGCEVHCGGMGWGLNIVRSISYIPVRWRQWRLSVAPTASTAAVSDK
eukprot:5826328-Pyramimonas_sp.AAC.1